MDNITYNRFTIRSASNGFTIERGWRKQVGEGRDAFFQWDDDLVLCSSWEDVVGFIENNKVVSDPS